MLTPAQAFPTRVAGVVRADDADSAFHACLAAVEGGVATIEVTMTVPECFDMVRGLVASTFGRVPVGIGTVMDPAHVPLAKRAHASFVVTPIVLPEVAKACAREDILCVVGALTPTEIHSAWSSGAGLVKIFPVQAVGGPDYIRWVRGPLPDIPFWVSGGVEIEQIDAYMRLGVAAVGLTTALFPPDAVQAGDTARITELARRAGAATPRPAGV